MKKEPPCTADHAVGIGASNAKKNMENRACLPVSVRSVMGLLYD
ncbi:MAG: hypothetical protein ABJO02_04740 [Reichenbachiella sp.]